MCNTTLPLFGKLPQWNLHANCHVNGTTFQSDLRFQTGLSSLRISCKRALNGNSKKQLRRKNSSWICGFFQNSCKAIFSRRYLRLDLLFVKYFLNVCWISVYNKRINAIAHRRSRFRCSGVFRWCSVSVPRCSVVPPLFRGVPCAVVPCSSVPGFIACLFTVFTCKYQVVFNQRKIKSSSEEYATWKNLTFDQ